jgi:hypothetical protein
MRNIINKIITFIFGKDDNKSADLPKKVLYHQRCSKCKHESPVYEKESK